MNYNIKYPTTLTTKTLTNFINKIPIKLHTLQPKILKCHRFRKLLRLITKMLKI